MDPLAFHISTCSIYGMFTNIYPKSDPHGLTDPHSGACGNSLYPPVISWFDWVWIYSCLVYDIPIRTTPSFATFLGMCHELDLLMILVCFITTDMHHRHEQLNPFRDHYCNKSHFAPTFYDMFI